ncbi:MAG: aldo/keto reductase, partial [Eubacterium sp.]|nr:aldo/keto reductase [Eubacterium sp.]
MIDRAPFKDTKLSRLGLGAMRLPVKTMIKREANPLIDYKEAQKLVDYAIENGINYFDTAYMYHVGKSEKFIGTALSKYPRESYYLADKLPIWFCKKPADMEKIFKTQLERTGAEYFDNYLLHALDGKNFAKCEEYGAYEFLKKKQDEGRIKNIGFSFHGTLEDLKTIVGAHHWDFAQIQLNYLDWTNQKAKEQYDI